MNFVLGCVSQKKFRPQHMLRDIEMVSAPNLTIPTNFHASICTFPRVNYQIHEWFPLARLRIRAQTLLTTWLFIGLTMGATSYMEIEMHQNSRFFLVPQPLRYNSNAYKQPAKNALKSMSGESLSKSVEVQLFPSPNGYVLISFGFLFILIWDVFYIVL